MFNPIKWLLEKNQPETKETAVTDTAVATDTPATESAVTTSPEVATTTETPVAVVKNGVKDFEAAFTFVEQGVAQLGEAAKEELKALAQKYL